MPTIAELRAAAGWFKAQDYVVQFSKRGYGTVKAQYVDA